MYITFCTHASEAVSAVQRQFWSTVHTYVVWLCFICEQTLGFKKGTCAKFSPLTTLSKVLSGRHHFETCFLVSSLTLCISSLYFCAYMCNHFCFFYFFRFHHVYLQCRVKDYVWATVYPLAFAFCCCLRAVSVFKAASIINRNLNLHKECRPSCLQSGHIVYCRTCRAVPNSPLELWVLYPSSLTQLYFQDSFLFPASPLFLHQFSAHQRTVRLCPLAVFLRV